MGALVKCIVAGVIGGVVGAVVWAVIAYQLNAEIGYVAWGIGLLVGVAVRIGAGGEEGPITGVVAAVIAAASVAGGKYAAVSAAVGDATAEVGTMIENVGDDKVFFVLVDDIAVEFANQGKPMAWPDGMTYEDATEVEHYPKEVVTEAHSRWDRADETWRNDFRAYAKDKMRANVAAATAAITQQGFIESFSVFDALWFLLAVGTAFAVGSGAAGGGD